MFFGLDHPTHELNIYENIPIEQPILYLVPVDYDSGDNGTVQFELLSGNEGGYFDLIVPIGEDPKVLDRLIVLNNSLDHESNSKFNFTIRLQDEGSPPLQTIQYIVINVLDVNDELPAFPTSSYSFEVPENHPIGKSHSFGIINATDEDSNIHNQIFYQFEESRSADKDVSDFVGVNTTTGELYLLERLNYDDTAIKHTYEFVIEARNPGSPLGTYVTITLTITDVNDEWPYVKDPEQFNVKENSNPHLFHIPVRDDDLAEDDSTIAEANVTFHPQVAHLAPTIVKFGSNTVVLVTITELLDRERDPTIIMTITLTDKGTPSLTSHTNIIVTVTDVNDNPPVFSQNSYVGRISASSQPNRLVTSVEATDADIGSNSHVTYSLVQAQPSLALPWFEINSTTGDILLVAAPNYTTDLVRLTVMAKDHGLAPMNSTSTVTITIIPPVTFQPLSYQSYRGINLISTVVFYLEFLTDNANASLLYQYDHNADTYAKLEIKNSNIEFFNGANYKNNHAIDTNVWYSVLFDSSNVSQQFDHFDIII